MPWQLKPNEPIYLQLIEEIKLRIATGQYASGSQLPAVRVLAQDAAVNPNTMQRALQELEREELIFTVRTSGKFVTEDSDKIMQIRLRLAQNYIKDFFEGMGKLGISEAEAVSLLNEKRTDKE